VWTSAAAPSAAPASIEGARGERYPPATPTNMAAQPPRIMEKPITDLIKLLILMEFFKTAASRSILKDRQVKKVNYRHATWAHAFLTSFTGGCL
jgi:hypothetical protein